MSLARQGKGKRNIPKFEDAGTTENNSNNSTNNETNEEVKQEVNNNINTNDIVKNESEEVTDNESETDSVDSIVSEIVHAPKPKEREQVSIYLDDDVKKAFEKFGRKNGKGARSNLVNSFLKKALKEYLK